MGSIPGLSLAHTEVPLKICWSVSCDTWQLPDCTWLVFFPNLHWTLAHSPFRLPKSSCFSYGSSRNPRSTSAVASLSPPHQENRIEWNSWCEIQPLWRLWFVVVCWLQYLFISLGTGVWAEMITTPINGMTTDTDVDSLRRMKWLCWDLSLHQAFCHDTGWHPCSQSVHTLWFRLPGGENEQEREMNVSPVWALQCSGLVPFISSARCDLYCHFCAWWL